MNFILIAQVYIVFKKADFDKGTGNESLGVVKKQQGSSTLQQFPG